MKRVMIGKSMKKLMVSLGAVALATAPLAISTPALADPGKGSAQSAAEFCQLYIQEDTSVSFGDCMGFARSDDSAALAKFCYYFKINGWLEGFGYKNQGDCVSQLRSLN